MFFLLEINCKNVCVSRLINLSRIVCFSKFPKTDYTYSKLSPHRREIKPGIIAMPNMSRRSLEIHQSRVHEMSARDPAKESYFRSRYLSMATLLKTRSERAADNYYDSQDENDLSQFGRNGNGSRLSSYYTASRTTSTTFIRRIVTLITSIWLTISTSVTRIFRKSETPKWSTYSRVQSGEGNLKMHYLLPILYQNLSLWLDLTSRVFMLPRSPYRGANK